MKVSDFAFDTGDCVVVDVGYDKEPGEILNMGPDGPEVEWVEVLFLDESIGKYAPEQILCLLSCLWA